VFYVLGPRQHSIGYRGDGFYGCNCVCQFICDKHIRLNSTQLFSVCRTKQTIYTRVQRRLRQEKDMKPMVDVDDRKYQQQR